MLSEITFKRPRKYQGGISCVCSYERGLQKERSQEPAPVTFLKVMAPHLGLELTTRGTPLLVITKRRRGLALSITDDSDSIPHHEYHN